MWTTASPLCMETCPAPAHVSVHGELELEVPNKPLRPGFSHYPAWAQSIMTAAKTDTAGMPWDSACRELPAAHLCMQTEREFCQVTLSLKGYLASEMLV